MYWKEYILARSSNATDQDDTNESTSNNQDDLDDQHSDSESEEEEEDGSDQLRKRPRVNIVDQLAQVRRKRPNIANRKFFFFFSTSSS